MGGGGGGGGKGGQGGILFRMRGNTLPYEAQVIFTLEVGCFVDDAIITVVHA